MTPILVTGDSHVAACALGAQLLDDPAARGRLTFWPLGQGGGAITDFYEVDREAGVIRTVFEAWQNRSYSRQSIQINGVDPVLAVSMPLNSVRLLRSVQWNVHVPWSMKVKAAERPLSDQAVDLMIDEDSRRAVAFSIELKELGVPVVVLEPPRLFGHARLLAEKRLDVCVAVESRYRDTVIQRLAEAGIPVITQPAETRADDGTTDQAFRHENPNDQHHSNPEYGRLLMRDLIDHVNSRGL